MNRGPQDIAPSLLSMDSDAALGRLAGDPWFALLGPALQAQLCRGAVPVRLNAGEYLVRQGDTERTFFALTSGMLKASTLRHDGKEAVLAIFEPIAWFGETSPIDGRPRTHDVVAITAAELLCIEPALFDQLMAQLPFARAVAQLQALHLRAVFELLEDATLRSTRARVARRLLRLARGDVAFHQAPRNVINVTHDTLAMMLGITRQTLALELKGLAASGAIAQRYGRISVVSMPALEAIEREG